MVCDPSVSVDVMQDAEPPVPRATLHNDVEPSKKTTVPVSGVPAFVTVALNVTALPTTLRLALEVSTTAVGLTLRTWPDRLMIAGPPPATGVRVTDPMTLAPMTFGANSTPRLH